MQLLGCFELNICLLKRLQAHNGVDTGNLVAQVVVVPHKLVLAVICLLDFDLGGPLAESSSQVLGDSEVWGSQVLPIRVLRLLPVRLRMDH